MDGEKGDQEDACLRLCGSLGSIVRLTWPLNFRPQGSLGGSTKPSSAPGRAGAGSAKGDSIWHMLLTIFRHIPIPWPLRVSSLRLLETQLALEKLHLVFRDEPSSLFTSSWPDKRSSLLSDCHCTPANTVPPWHGHADCGRATLLGELLWTRQQWVDAYVRPRSVRTQHTTYRIL